MREDYTMILGLKQWSVKVLGNFKGYLNPKVKRLAAMTEEAFQGTIHEGNTERYGILLVDLQFR